MYQQQADRAVAAVIAALDDAITHVQEYVQTHARIAVVGHALRNVLDAQVHVVSNVVLDVAEHVRQAVSDVLMYAVLQIVLITVRMAAIGGAVRPV